MLLYPLTNNFLVQVKISSGSNLLPSGNTLAWFSKSQLHLAQQSMRTSSLAKRVPQNQRSACKMHTPLSVHSQRASRRKSVSVESSSQEGRRSGSPLLAPTSRALQYCFLTRPPVPWMLSQSMWFTRHLIELWRARQRLSWHIGFHYQECR